jgi:hypothetical protein
MSEHGASERAVTARPRSVGLGLFWVLVAVVLLLLGYAISQLVDESSRLRVSADATQFWAYATVFLLVFLDGICALFPAETTLNTATALAVEGHLNTVGIAVAGALGAVGGDSAL